MAGKINGRTAKEMIWIGRIIGLLLSSFWLIFIIMEFKDSGFSIKYFMQTDQLFFIIFIAENIMALVGIILSWRKNLVPSVLLLLLSWVTGSVMSIISHYYYGRHNNLGILNYTFIICLPYLLSGILILCSRWLSKKKT